MRLRLPFACQQGCALCSRVLALDAEVLPEEEWRAQLEHAVRMGHRRIYVQGTDVAGFPHLAAIARAAKDSSLQLALVEDASGGRLPEHAGRLQQLGVKHVFLPLCLPADTTSLDKAAPRQVHKGSLVVLIALVQDRVLTVGIHLPLRAEIDRELATVLRAQARLSIRELLVSAETDAAAGLPAVDAAPMVTALDRVWRAANALQIRLHVIGFESARHVHPPMGEPAASCDQALLEIVRHGLPLIAARAGIRTPRGRTALRSVVSSIEEIRALGLELAARRNPFLDLPACLGGAQAAGSPASADASVPMLKSMACGTCPLDEACRGALEELEGFPATSIQSALRPLPAWYACRRLPRVLITSSEGQDPILYISTLPALAAALKERGAEVEIVSPWMGAWDPRNFPGPGQPRTAEWKGTSGFEEWLRTHDLSRFDLVITPDLPVARLALAAKGLRAEARVVLVDFHMLKGMDVALGAWLAPGARPSEGGWWPAPQLVLESAFPSYVQLYLNYGVPLEQVTWRPYTLYPGHFPAGPDVHRCEVIFSGGNHLRDLETLRQATILLPAAVHAVDLYAPGDPIEGNAHLRHRGVVRLALFHDAVANSRFAVLPLRSEPNHAAGVTVLVMALMAGRPVVTTDIPAARDYVQHGVEALLVPPGDPVALADAIARLDGDRALLSSMSAAARETGQRLSTEHWATQIVSGAPPTPHWTPQGWRNW